MIALRFQSTPDHTQSLIDFLTNSIVNLNNFHQTYSTGVPVTPTNNIRSAYAFFKAIISISIFAPNGNEATPIVVLAGKGSVNKV